MNSVNLIGRLVQDPKTSTTRSMKDVSHFTIAINNKASAVFVPVTAWEPLCDTVDKYLRKGNQVGVTGRLSTSSNGNLEIIASSIYLVDSKKQSTKELEDECEEFPY